MNSAAQIKRQEVIQADLREELVGLKAVRETNAQLEITRLIQIANVGVEICLSQNVVQALQMAELLRRIEAIESRS